MTSPISGSQKNKNASADIGFLRAREEPRGVSKSLKPVDCVFYHKMIISHLQYTTKGGQLLDGFQAKVQDSQSSVDIHPPLVLPFIEQTVHLFDVAICAARLGGGTP